MKFDKLWKYISEHSDKSPKELFKELNIPNDAIFAMRHAGDKNHKSYKKNSIDLKIIDKLCNYFQCQPSDIMELSEE